MFARSLPIFICALTLWVCVGLGLTTVRAGSVEDLDRANGFPDAQLGTPVGNFQGLEQTEETGRWTTYRRPTDRLKYGKFELSAISYNFFKGKLYSIFLDVEGRRNTRGILKLLEEAYGKPYSFESRQIPRNETKLEIREWSGKRVYLIYKNGEDFVGGKITLLDKPTWDFLQVPKEDRRKEIRKMLDGSFTNGDF